jgi:hypothetical protein
MKKENRIVAYPTMWIVLKLRKEAKEKKCTVSSLVASILFQYFNNKK